MFVPSESRYTHVTLLNKNIYGTLHLHLPLVLVFLLTKNIHFIYIL